MNAPQTNATSEPILSSGPTQLAEFLPLPPPKKRQGDLVSRSWLYQQVRDGNLRALRIRQRGKLRGRVFFERAEVVALIRRLAAEDAANPPPTRASKSETPTNMPETTESAGNSASDSPAKRKPWVIENRWT